MPASSSAGFGTGLREGLASARERRLRDQELARAQRRQDEQDRRVAEEHNLAMQQSRFGLERARLTAQRQDQEYARTQEELSRRNQDEGVVDFVNALNAGVDPQQAMQLFNSRGQHKLADVQIDPVTKRLRMTDSDGETHEFKDANEFAYAMGVEPAKQEREKLIASDKPIYDPNTGRWIQPPESQDELSLADRYLSVDGRVFDKQTGGFLSPDGDGGAGGGRKLATYNDLSVQKEISAAIVSAHGGKTGEIEELTDPDTRDLVAYKNALGTSIEGRFREDVMAGRLTPRQIADATLEATKDLPTEAKLAQLAEEWRTEPLGNRSQEDAAKWLSAEREKLHAQAIAKLNENIQKMLDATSDGHPDVFEKPDWAEAEITEPILDERGQPAQLQPGDTWEATDESGRNITVRVSSDGRVYTVKGEGRASMPEQGEMPGELHLNTALASAPATSSLETARQKPRRMPPVVPFNQPSNSVPKGDLAAMRFQRAIDENMVPRAADVKQLQKYDDATLNRMFGPDATMLIRDYGPAMRSLADARRRAEFVY